MTKSNPNAGSPSPAMLNPTNHCLAFIDAVALMSFSVSNTSRDELRNKVAIVANAAKIFNVPTVVSTVSTAAFISPVFQEIIDVYPDLDAYVPRTSMNAWEEPGFYRAVTSKNKKKIVLAGLRTGVCINGATLSAINEGYEVYIITDACGDVTMEAHERAVTRMVQAGAQPITAIQYLLELQRDWARTETVPAVGELVQRYAGIFGLVLHDISHKPVKQITYRSWRNIKVFPSKAVNEGSPFSLPLFTALICKA